MRPSNTFATGISSCSKWALMSASSLDVSAPFGSRYLMASSKALALISWFSVISSLLDSMLYDTLRFNALSRRHSPSPTQCPGRFSVTIPSTIACSVASNLGRREKVSSTRRRTRSSMLIEWLTLGEAVYQ